VTRRIVGSVHWPGTADGGGRGRVSVRMVIGTTAAVLLVVVIVVSVALWFERGGGPRTVSACWIKAQPSHTYTIDLEQAANATTISAVGKRLGLPDHAVTVALAAALQESQLRNLHYGDRDSLGLFQQRPSQGWGTPAQLLDPQYAAGAFFKALAQVPGWETRSVTSAAQAVQHSGAPGAYATWVPLARRLAIAATGEVPAGLTCQFALGRSTTPPRSVAPVLTRLFGPNALGPPSSQARGWAIATWLVAHAEPYRIVSVRFATREWTPRGDWRTTQANGGVQVTQSTLATG